MSRPAKVARPLQVFASAVGRMEPASPQPTLYEVLASQALHLAILITSFIVPIHQVLRFRNPRPILVMDGKTMSVRASKAVAGFSPHPPSCPKPRCSRQWYPPHSADIKSRLMCHHPAIRCSVAPIVQGLERFGADPDAIHTGYRSLPCLRGTGPTVFIGAGLRGPQVPPTLWAACGGTDLRSPYGRSSSSLRRAVAFILWPTV